MRERSPHQNGMSLDIHVHAIDECNASARRKLGNPIRGGSEVPETPPPPPPRIGTDRGSEVRQPPPPPCCLGVHIKNFKNHQNQPKLMGRRHGRHSKQTQHQNNNNKIDPVEGGVIILISI